MAKDLANKATVPVAVHLDHSASYEIAVGGIRDGFPSVMVDGSALPYEENIEVTKAVVMEYLTKCNEVLSHVSVLEDERLRAQCRNMGRFQPVDCPHPECRCTNVADAIRHRRTCANRRPVDNDMLKN